MSCADAFNDGTAFYEDGSLVSFATKQHCTTFLELNGSSGVTGTVSCRQESGGACWFAVGSKYKAMFGKTSFCPTTNTWPLWDP